MRKIVAVINVLFLFALLGISGCTTHNGMRSQTHPAFWSDQSVQSGTYANEEQTGTYNGKYTKAVGQRRLQSSHIV